MSPLRVLRETIFREFSKVKEASTSVADHGIGTPLAEYAETGPYHCENCVFVILRNKAHTVGLCSEKHMLKDQKTTKNSKGLAVVKLITGCCRFVKPQEGDNKK